MMPPRPATAHEAAEVVGQDQGCTRVEVEHSQLGVQLVGEEVGAEGEAGVVDQQVDIESFGHLGDPWEEIISREVRALTFAWVEQR